MGVHGSCAQGAPSLCSGLLQLPVLPRALPLLEPCSLWPSLASRLSFSLSFSLPAAPRGLAPAFGWEAPCVGSQGHVGVEPGAQRQVDGPPGLRARSRALSVFDPHSPQAKGLCRGLPRDLHGGRALWPKPLSIPPAGVPTSWPSTPMGTCLMTSVRTSGRWTALRRPWPTVVSVTPLVHPGCPEGRP